MAQVRIGSARGDENNRAHGGKAGDQTGKEVSTQAWYKHSKGWYVFRAKDSVKAEKIAQCMEDSCANRKIGYDQFQRLTLYNAVKPYGFNVNKLETNVETDCSALVRVCCAYAGITVGNFYTSTEKNMLLSTGAFSLLEGAKYEASSDYLKRGDILCTKKKGHTVVVLSDGCKAEELKFLDYELGDRVLYNGLHGDDVKDLQDRLISLGYSCGDFGADGDFGDCTELAVKYFQDEHMIEGSGVVDAKTLTAILDAEDTEEHNYLEIRGGNCWFRSEPNKTTSKKICVLKNGYNGLKKLGHEDGWYHAKIIDGGFEGYISDKYCAEVDGL